MTSDDTSVDAATNSTEIPLAHRVVRGSLWVAGGSYINLICGFLANLALTRLLTPKDFGFFALAQFFFALINLRPKVSVGPAFAQRKDTTAALVTTHLVLDVTAGLLTVVVAALAAPLIHIAGYSWDVSWLVLAFACIGVSDGFMGTAWTLLDKNLHLTSTSVVSTVAFVASYVPALWLALHHGSYWSLVAQNVAYSVLLLVGLWWTARRIIPDIWKERWRFDRHLARQLLTIGLPVGATTLTGLLVGQLDNWLVGTFVSVAALGLYTRAYNLAQWPGRLVTNVISQAAFYTYTRLQDDRVRLQRTVSMTLWLTTTLALPLALGIFVAAPDLVRYLYGSRWADSALYLRFLVVYAAMGPLLSDAGWMFIAVGRPRLSVRVSLAQVVTLAALGLVLTMTHGVVGTCLAVGATFVVGLVLTYRYVVQLISLSIWSSLGVPGIASLLTLGGYALSIRAIDPNAHWPLAIAIVVKIAYAACAYLVALFVLQPRETVARTAYVLRLARGRPAIARPLPEETM